ncbi:MAG: GntR family transcriptional regulator, transcriptional repressor for pyruvate dehydrogenase complex [Clostridia bacterium]|jgi:GntR family transcriptional repressor for pyruvate dehydrogenase complex|nr:GntR family transcriptional regulator, transcriptional repressor for pyruvate dehydrogenase complex [Clostridia bacterium]
MQYLTDFAKKGRVRVKIKRNKLYEEVVNRIVEDIKQGEMQVGEKLPSEKELAKNFGVSRMAIREALSVLETAGVVEVKHGLGIFIKDINEELINPITQSLLCEKDSLLNILELRRGLETEGAYLAAFRATAEDIKELEEILEDMDADVRKGGSAVDEDYKFHTTLIQATGNPIYIKVFNTITNIFYDGLKTSHSIIQKRRSRLVVYNEHKVILDHIKNRQPEEAREAMRVHLKNVEYNLRKLI